MNSFRRIAVSLCGLIGIWSSQDLAAGEANPLPPQVTFTVTNGQQRVSWTPVPAADQFRVLSTTNIMQPCVEDTLGTVLGYDWTAPADGSMAFHRVAITPLSSNEIFAATVLHRLTYGPTSDDLDRIAAIGPQAFIDEQMAPATAITDTVDVDPPITNAPLAVPALPPLTNWIRVSATSNLTQLTNFYLYLSAAGRVYIDDVRVVLGTNADVGTNLLTNGDFEDPLTNGWKLGANYAGSLVTNSPTVDGLAASGTNCVLLIGTSAGNPIEATLWQPIATNIPPASQRYALSFSYLPVQNTSNTTLTARLSGSQTIRTVTLPPSPPAPPTPPTPPPAIAPTYARLTNGIGTLDDLRAWHLFRAVHSPRQLHEVLVEFFENHFTTQYQKTKEWFDGNYANAITNEAVRAALSVDFEFRENAKWRQWLLNPNCTFYDLLKVSIESPAMIIYLDTVLNSRSAANENYGRELLELHAMGVDNGYIQQDIVAMAQVWTGWRVAKKSPENANNPFAPPVANLTNDVGSWVLHFVTNSHNYTSNKWMFTNSLVDPRFGPPWAGRDYSLKINRNQYPLTNGMQEGYVVIEHLANLPQTMEFLSVKLCRLFVHEDFEFGVYDYATNAPSPEAELVRNCMLAWDSPGPDGRKGNLRQVLNVIFNSALFRGHAASRQKIKTPLEFAVSAVRALRVSGTDTNGWVSTTADTDGYGLSGLNNTSPLSRMGGMTLFNRAEPDGFSEFGRIWLNTANLCERMRFAQHLLMAGTGSLKTSDYGNPGSKNVSDPARLLQRRVPPAGWKDAGAVADFFLGLLFPGEGKANLDLDRNSAINFLNTNEAGGPAPFANLTVGTAVYDGRLRGMVAMLLCLPRFQEQ